MNARNRKTAECYGLLSRLTALETDLLQIPGVVSDALDEGCYLGVDNFSDIPQVCACIAFSFFVAPIYDESATISERASAFLAASEAETQCRRKCLQSIIETCQRHGLTRSGDRIEDYGAHWYIVFNAFNWK